ncbi:CaiB/BaiF CoA transferase family protein [Micromonospora carbonacea]|uniref:CaiB/BaiF CoA transferase family protein n=1 Tax=Micromonospora carbonacea TaxID=47853 RepID=UPI0017ED824E|nr:CoA transferase [Micromonospora carbonacea]MBB5827328.1 crotonobetainyl-CoA:carnitine CoA-transferase CaiB-like acyl-CoA transferase [Micromonospora carbonacea]
MTGALGGLLVADFSRVLAGPYATMLLADLGADVVKVERPGSGDDTRSWGPPYDVDGTATYYLAVNRNKRSITLDLTDPADLAVARELACRADVVVENFRPGTMARHGLGYADIAETNPRVIYCSVTGFGSGAGADRPGYDLLVQAVGGLMSITGIPPGEPVKTGVAVVDVITGLHATIGVLAALRHREATGEGQHVELSLLSSLLSALVNQASGYVSAGVVPGPLGNAHPSVVPYQVLPTADRPLAVAVGTDAQFAALCAVLDLPAVAADPRYLRNADRVRHRETLTATLTERTLTRPAHELAAALGAVGVPSGPVNDLAGAFDLATELGLAPVVEIDGPGRARPARQVANPITLSHTPAAYRRPPPRLGEHTDAVLDWLAAPPPAAPAAGAAPQTEPSSQESN